MLIAVATLTQNIAPLVLIGVGVLLWTTYHALSIARPVVGWQPRYTIGLPVIAFFCVGGIYWQIVTNYIPYHVNRVIAILTVLSSGQDVVEDTNVAGTPMIELFDHLLPDVLLWAAPVLTTAFIVGVVGYLLLEALLSQGDTNIPAQYTVFASLIFGGFAGVFAAGGEDVVRALPIVLVIVAPLAGYFHNRLSVSRGHIGAGLAVVVIIFVAISGVLAPPVAKAERSYEDFRKYLTSSEIAGAEWTMAHTDSASSGPYVSGYDRYSQERTGTFATTTIEEGFSESDAESIADFEQRAANGETVVLLDYYQAAFGVEPPDTHRIYSSGKTSVYTGLDTGSDELEDIIR